MHWVRRRGMGALAHCSWRHMLLTHAGAADWGAQQWPNVSSAVSPSMVAAVCLRISCSSIMMLVCCVLGLLLRVVSEIRSGRLLGAADSRRRVPFELLLLCCGCVPFVHDATRLSACEVCTYPVRKAPHAFQAACWVTDGTAYLLCFGVGVHA